MTPESEAQSKMEETARKSNLWLTISIGVVLDTDLPGKHVPKAKIVHSKFCRLCVR